MTQVEAGLLMLALMVLALGLAYWGWSRRRQRYAHLQSSLLFSVPPGEALVHSPALYVATTLHDQPLERVPVGPLAYRARAELEVHHEGLVVSIPGHTPFVMPAAGGLQAGVATWTIDRVVEPGGLLMVRWLLGEVPVDSYFRVVDRDPATIISAINQVSKGHS